MKIKFLSALCLSVLGMLLFVPNTAAQGTDPHNIVRLVYFVPYRRQPQSDIDVKLDTLIKNVQAFFADEMERHGFGRKTFQFEIDRHGNAVVHRVTGKFLDTHYHEDTVSKVVAEVPQRFDFLKNVYLVVVDVSTGLIDSVCGRGGDVWNTAGDWGGRAFIPASGDCLNTRLGFELTAHELGHAFGLAHDFRKSAYIMSYGQNPDQLARCTAEWLHANRYFNDHRTHANNHETTIEMLAAEADPDYTIRFRFKISDADGLRHVHLMTPATSIYEDPGSSKLIDCKKLEGNSQNVEFATNQLTPESQSITVRVVDAAGNLSSQDYPIDINAILPTPRVVSIPDVNLAAAIRNELRLTRSSHITELDMLNLTALSANHKQIIELTGLEYAKNLKHLALGFNQITDVSTLAQLTNLEELSIPYNPVEDLTPIKALTGLRALEVRGYNLLNVTLDANLFTTFPDLVHLAIGSNGITDITPLTQLKRLRYLSAISNQIRDLTPIAQMPNLVFLELWYNQVNDLTPFTGLTNLQFLYLPGNPLADLTPLSGLKNLKHLDISGDINGGAITDLTPLATLTNLEALRADRNKIRSIRPLRKLEHLEILSLEDNQISDMRPFTKLVKLSTLRLARNPISDITPLQTLSNRNPRLAVDIDLTQLSPILEIIDPQLPPLYWTDTETSGFHRFIRSQTSVEHTALGVLNITALVVDTEGGKIYWTEQTGNLRGDIGCANLDGSNAQVLKSFFSLPRDIAIDTRNGKIYCTNAIGKIQRLNFNGSKFEANLITNLDTPEHITLDIANGKIYWTAAAERIQQANLDGSNVQTVIIGLETPGGLTVAADKLYWTERTGKNAGKIQRANLDGTNVQTLATLKSAPIGIAVDTHGRKVYWTNAAGRIQRANLNGKNIQNVVTGLAHPIDLVLRTDTDTTPVAAAPAVVRPATTNLLPNYPNPSNPETWIPYQLASPADVTLTIYAINGQLIRTLALGHQPTGIYQSRSRAAYWDGRNRHGEPVASGIYFYTLSTEATRDSVPAGNFTATRKMIIVK